MRSDRARLLLLPALACLLGVTGCPDDDTSSASDDPKVMACRENPDGDEDGWSRSECGGYDCDDDDPERSPGNTELCDKQDVDEDCNWTTPGYRDDDEDGYIDAKCKNYDDKDEVASSGLDCDDAQPDVHPGLHEACNERDDDCDREIDEGVLVPSYEDADGDGYGHGKERELCAGTTGFASIAGDCDDDNAQIHPDAFRCDESTADTSDIEVCDEDAQFSAGSCADSGVCVTQPDGTGVCLAP